jgi:hypothetical protein
MIHTTARSRAGRFSLACVERRWRQTLATDAGEWLLRVEDIAPLVARQRQLVRTGDLDSLLTPRETVYPIADAELARRRGMSQPDRDGSG